MKTIIRVNGLCCANCANKMQNGIAKLEGVSSATVSFMTQKISIEHEADKREEIIREAIKICKRIEPDLEINL